MKEQVRLVLGDPAPFDICFMYPYCEGRIDMNGIIPFCVSCQEVLTEREKDRLRYVLKYEYHEKKKKDRIMAAAGKRIRERRGLRSGGINDSEMSR